MIIQQLILQPFAGISNRTVSFKAGLNVVVGPNEAGKTTLVNSLKSVLFTPTKLTKRQTETKITPYLPLHGGDTIRITLQFGVKGHDYVLAKSWGKQASTELKLPGGQILADADGVQEKLTELLGLKCGTYEHVLIACQADHPQTLDELGRDSTDTQDLADLLRKAVFATDGVSLEHLGQAITQRQARYYSRWDRSLMRPEDGRGIDNPWRSSVGEVLKAYYVKESIRKERERAEQFERRLDALNEQINTVSDEKKALQKFLEETAGVAADVAKRATLELERKEVARDETAFRDIAKEWPRLEERLNTLQENSNTGNRQLEQLVQELVHTRAFEASQAKRDKLARAQNKFAELVTAKKELAAIKPLTFNDLKRLESLDADLKRHVASLKAGRIRLRLTPHKPFAVVVRRDLESEQETDLVADVPLELEAGGRLALRHQDWELDVQSGEAAFDQVSAAHAETAKKLEKLLSDLGVDGLEAAQVLHQDFQSRTTAVSALDRQLTEILDGDDLETLTRDVAEVAPALPRRVSADVAEEKGRLESAQNALQTQIMDARKKLNTWQEQFGSQDGLLNALVNVKCRLNEKNAAIDALKPLPDGVTDADAFVAEFREKERRFRTIKEDTLPGLVVQRAELENESPDQSLQNLDAALAVENATFSRVVKEAAAIDRIAGVFARLREQMDASTLDPWIREMRRVVEPLTGGRYIEVRLEESTAGRADELPIPYDALSMGTRTCLGLAIRLSMARHFLDGREGFLLLDDPLVDLDPERQEAASAILRHFADDKQVIILTCHPSHAALLGGHRIELSGSRRCEGNIDSDS